MINSYSHIFEKELSDQINNIQPVNIPKGTLLLNEASYIKEIPLVISGSIKVRKCDETGKEIILYHISPGESCILSITSCLNEKQCNAEAITEEDTELIVVPADAVRKWMDTYKSWRRFVMHLYYDRLDALLYLVDSISFKQTDSRLYEKLQQLEQIHGNEIRITHQQLASEIGTAREVISRLLKQMEKDGVITLERGVIILNKAL